MDLDVDFDQSDRPRLVTTLLAQCSERGDAAFWWAEPLGARTAALLQLVALTEGRDEISLSARCQSPACGESFEFELPLRSLPAGQPGAGPLHVRLADNRELTLRRPTGDDLRRWHDAAATSRTEALSVMLESLVIAGQARPEDEAALSASIEALDPLIDFAVACCCPACGASSEVPVDLEGLALARLAARQRVLVHEVHRLASGYGWTESEALAVPAARRARYLALIEDRR